MFTIGSPRTENLRLKSPLADTTETEREETAKTQQLAFALATNPGMPFQMPLKCNACALVSSSGMLLGSNAGSQIDSTDCVFRLNSAPTLGFEKDVGSKTTVRVLSVASFKSLIRETWQRALNSFEDADYLILLGSEKLLCKNCTLSKLYQRLSQYLGNTKLLQVTKENYEMVRQEWNNPGINVMR